MRIGRNLLLLFIVAIVSSRKRKGGLIMAIQIKKAQRSMARLKIGIAGSSGSGKT